MPRRLQELRLQLRAARQGYTEEHGHAPTVPQIAHLLGISEEETIELMSVTDAYRPISLETPIAAEDGAETLGDLLGDDDPAYDDIVDTTALRPMLDQSLRNALLDDTGRSCRHWRTRRARP